MKRMVVLVLALCVAACSDDSTAPAGADQLVVGALLSLTGPGRTLGQTSEAALQLAADDLNAQLSGNGSPIRVSVRVQDSGRWPDRACASSSAPSPAPKSPRSSRLPTAAA
jgi:branched-chain amino acid transport system substrate-binding protein